MSTMQRGLGRGLDALFKGGGRTEGSGETQKVPLSSLTPNPHQPRRHFAEQQLEELAASIKTQGLLQPILARPVPGAVPQKYEIVAGERRWRASTLAGLDEVPVIIRELNDQEALVVALVENLQREDLNPLEEAQGMQQLREEFSLSQEDLAQRLGKSRSAIANTLRLLSLPEAARRDLAEGRLSAGHARALLSITDATAQEALRLRIVRNHMPVREAEACTVFWKEHGELPESAEELPARKSVARARAGAKAPALAALQEEMSGLLAQPVRISGTEDRGRISISYASQHEFASLLARLGLTRSAP